MKQSNFFLLGLILSACNQTVQKETVPFTENNSGIHQAIALEQLPYRKTGVISKQTSSMNKDGGNNDRRCYPYINATNDEAVLMEEYGPGCIHRIQTSSSWDKGAHIRINIDGNEVVYMSCDDFFSMKKPGFPAPLVADKRTSSGTSFSYVPMVFHSYCKVSLSKYKGKNHFQVQYHKYADVPAVPAYSKDQDVTALQKLWNNGGKLLPYFSDTEAIEGSKKIREGTNELLAHTGPGTIAGIRIQLPESYKTVQQCRIQMTWDGAKKPQVDVPLGLFFSGAIGYKPYKSILVGIGPDKTAYLNYPMPFWKSVKIVLKNDSGTSFDLNYRFYISEKVYADHAGYFNAWYHEEKPTTAYQDYTLLKTGGWGHWVATHHLLEGRENLGFLEGDERIYYDGMQTPALQGSGYEDFYNGSYYFQYGEYNLPISGVQMMRHIYESTDGWEDRVISERIEEGSSHLMLYRHLVTDWIPFNDGIKAGAEVGPEGNQERMYESVSFFYGKPESKLVQTDEINVGDAVSEKAHDYQVKQAKAIALTSTYEGDHDDVEFSDDGNSIEPGGSSTFKVNIDERNIGVKLRRRLDYSKLNQKAKVMVDGEEAGIWFTVGNNEHHSMREDEFLIPTALTKGKKEIRVSIEPMPSSGDQMKDGQQPNPENNTYMERKTIPEGPWTELHYGVHCVLE